MTMRDESFAERRSPYMSGGEGRLTLWCAAWAVLALAGGAMAALSAGPGGLLAGVIVAGFSLQAAIAEYAGVRTGRASISAPRRLAAVAPFLAFWREEIPWSEVIDITALPNAFGVERVLLRRAMNVRTPVFLPTRDAKLALFEAAACANPNVSVYRAR